MDRRPKDDLRRQLLPSEDDAADAQEQVVEINRDKVAELQSAGRMQPAGLAAVERAKRVGTWEHAYDPPSLANVPEDLQAALDAHPEAAAFFESLNSRNRYAILYRVHDAKRPETRARRIAQFIDMLARREKLY
jgi:uncharacterized protein YdeI (YjbR/CyaY-like superfamily)